MQAVQCWVVEVVSQVGVDALGVSCGEGLLVVVLVTKGSSSTSCHTAQFQLGSTSGSGWFRF